MQYIYAFGDAEKRKLSFLYQQSSIDTRYSVIPDYSRPLSEWKFYPQTENLDPFPSLEHRMTWYQKYAAPLSMHAVRDCLDGKIGDWAGSQQQDSGEDTQKQREAIYGAGEYNSEVPMKDFIFRNGIDRDNSDFGQDLEEAWTSGYDSGTARATQQGQRSQTGG